MFAILLRYLDTRFWTDRFAQVTGHTILAIHRLRLSIHQLEHSIGAIVNTGTAANTKLWVHFDQDNNLTSLVLRQSFFSLPFQPNLSHIIENSRTFFLTNRLFPYEKKQ